ncbi:hypothetical protein ABT297_36695 [Dactylosporangium sp. NPDC000555]|uniref:hypothetical protein n=1 Tax=Dactylosporangium sp. NPDC000555 TaxID=3154260 RepID=UPI00332EBF61
MLYAQTVSSISTLRRDQIVMTSDGARLVFGTAPIDLPQPMAALLTALIAQRTGTERAASPWLFPGRPRTEPITAGQLPKRLAVCRSPNVVLAGGCHARIGSDRALSAA